MDQIKNMEISSLDLLKSLPDLFWDLNELGIGTHLSRGNVTREYTQYLTVASSSAGTDSAQSAPLGPQAQVAGFTDIHNFFVDGLAENEKRRLADFLLGKNANIVKVGEMPNHLHLRLTIQGLVSQKPSLGYYPDIVEDINGGKFYILRPDRYVHESAAFLVTTFCLGMLSRYYPDVWMRVIENNVDAVEVINLFLNVVVRKLPNLILDQLSGVKHFIHM